MMFFLPLEITPEGHKDSPTQEAPHDNDKRKDDIHHKSESSTSTTSSSDENIARPFELLELQDNVKLQLRQDQLISLHLSHTLEDCEAHYKENMDYHISTITTMLKKLENEIHHKDAMKMVMQEVFIKVIHAAQHHLDVPNYKFDEMLHIIDETFNHLKAQAPTAEA
ncbi:unnamed protein product [Lactuca saligna]|uniref:Uncharacterized protein n=1 Tax=Lactuca saligna TaxID=75948 RepID=A0AA35YVE7_LACSI|nr:unnamed protein product [Lactuca saligna]